jgi:hypothetical protein
MKKIVSGITLFLIMASVVAYSMYDTPNSLVDDQIDLLMDTELSEKEYEEEAKYIFDEHSAYNAIKNREIVQRIMMDMMIDAGAYGHGVNDETLEFDMDIEDTEVKGNSATVKVETQITYEDDQGDEHEVEGMIEFKAAKEAGMWFLVEV